ncbi:MAG TPA: hypothetical protein VGG64_04920 [Pirellulales bacterium]|jgi:hypothetical protein
MELVQENIVLTARHVNVHIFTQIWLHHQGIVLENEYAAPMIFTPAIIQIVTPQFQMTVVEERIQFVPLGEEPARAQLILDRLGRLVNALPHTPYQALGLNFSWHHTPTPTAPIEVLGRRLFLKQDSALAHAFDGNDAKFGAYYSKNVFGGFRCKLSTLPIDVLQEDGSTQERLQFSFNYHLAAATPDEIVGALGHWDEAKRHAHALIASIEDVI